MLLFDSRISWYWTEIGSLTDTVTRWLFLWGLTFVGSERNVKTAIGWIEHMVQTVEFLKGWTGTTSASLLFFMQKPKLLFFPTLFKPEINVPLARTLLQPFKWGKMLLDRYLPHGERRDICWQTSAAMVAKPPLSQQILTWMHSIWLIKQELYTVCIRGYRGWTPGQFYGFQLGCFQ